MRIFQDIPIKWKLTLIAMLASSIALTLACLSVITYDYVSFKNAMVRNLEILAKVIGDNSTAALVFDDKKDAEEILAALKTQHRIESARIYAMDGQVFASYNRDDIIGDLSPIEVCKYGYRFEGGSLSLFRQITLDDENIGTIFMQTDLEELHSRLWGYIKIIAAVIMFASLSAFLAASKLQVLISEPILKLTQVAREVSVQKDYSVRAEKINKDEVGLLVDSFNEMLKQIQERDMALQKAHYELEERVKERTAALSSANEQLKREIVERKRAEGGLKSFAARLERSNRELQDFASVASHDLQEPLRKVLAFGNRLRVVSGDELTEKGLDYLERMCSATRRMQTLINDLLSFSRVTSKAQPFVALDLNRVVQEVLSDLEVRIEQLGGQVEVEPLPTIDADPMQMRQLLQNLIGNALKFHRKEQAPIVRIKCKLVGKDEQQAISHAPMGEFCQIVIQDNGIGFKEKHKDRIFGVFHRLHGKDEYEGTGVGLAICRKIVERHGGSIEAKSKLGQGATFIVSLPLKQSKGGTRDERKQKSDHYIVS